MLRKYALKEKLGCPNENRRFVKENIRLPKEKLGFAKETRGFSLGNARISLEKLGFPKEGLVFCLRKTYDFLSKNSDVLRNC